MFRYHRTESLTNFLRLFIDNINAAWIQENHVALQLLLAIQLVLQIRSWGNSIVMQCVIISM